MADTTSSDLLNLTSDIVTAHVANNRVERTDVPNLIRSIYDALRSLGEPEPAPEPETPKGAVSVRKSLASPSHILSMIDGRPYTMLRRHLRTHGYTPESYRAAFGLPRDYPMTAPGYAAMRSELAKRIGLGRKPKAQPAPAPEPAKTPARRGRKPKALTAAIDAAKGHLGGE